MMRAISLGWGTQSFGLAAMVALGELPPVDVAIHSDTTHERSATYEFAAKWTPWLEDRGVRVVTVRPKIAPAPLVDQWGGVLIPVYTATERGGQIKRQCTGDWKIAPIRRWLQANRRGRPVELWLGISADEVGRVKPSDVRYIAHRWPLLEGPTWRRHQIVAWLADKGIDLPPRSACYFCPYQSRREWRALQGTDDWARAVAVDETIRAKRPPFDLFLHASRIPLARVDFRSEQERGQMELDGFDSECSGSCGL